jgi:hypothetical protein
MDRKLFGYALMGIALVLHVVVLIVEPFEKALRRP